MNPGDPIPPSEDRRAAVHRERADAIDALREQIAALEAREPELRREITEFERAQRARLAELERTRRTTLAELEKTQRATLAELERALREQPEDAEASDEELVRTRSELDEELMRTRNGLDEELTRVRTELDEELAGMRTELAAIRPSLIDARCTLGMKMSDFALEEHDGHERAIEYLQPLLAELRSGYSRALGEAKRSADEADEALKALEADHHATTDAALPLVERRFQPLIDAEVIGATIEQANARVARHRLAVVESVADDPDSDDPRLARELELEAAVDRLDAARAKISALQEEKQAAVHRYSHPNVEKGKHLGEQLAKRFRRHS